jgi:hypothetical protein
MPTRKMPTQLAVRLLPPTIRSSCRNHPRSHPKAMQQPARRKRRKIPLINLRRRLELPIQQLNLRHSKRLQPPRHKFSRACNRTHLSQPKPPQCTSRRHSRHPAQHPSASIPVLIQHLRPRLKTHAGVYQLPPLLTAAPATADTPPRPQPYSCPQLSHPAASLRTPPH